MQAKLIDGKAVSAALREQLKEEVAALAEDGITPGLAVVIVGDDPASKVYVRNKKKACEELGLHSEEYALPAETTQEELLALVDKLNKKPDIDGILVQLPLPAHLDEKAVIEAISPDKDVDAFSAVNVGKIMIGDYKFLPCTPAGIMELIKSTGIEVKGRECVVVGRSNIVGKPMAMLLLHQHGTVTICHSRTADLPSVTRRADHPRRRGRQGEVRHRRHGEARRGRHRRGNEPRPRTASCAATSTLRRSPRSRARSRRCPAASAP